LERGHGEKEERSGMEKMKEKKREERDDLYEGNRGLRR
jgi:hypothetical protein